ncbi:hypothetical protein [Roseateles depolymerans]|uniref:hypothetical protein n=2 Tax=Roseateles depolymerans TaxID=76731 RepID=UPI0011C02E72|nr:hypothetical protein [Roseateles depolymerans]
MSKSTKLDASSSLTPLKWSWNQMHDVFEIAFRELVSEHLLKDLLSNYFQLDIASIVSEHDYWSDAWDGLPRIGISIAIADDGLKTNVSGYSFQPIADPVLGDLAKEAAKVFQSEAVIGDFGKHGIEAIGRFLSYLPDGSIWESVDSSDGPIDDVMPIRRIE